MEKFRPRPEHEHKPRTPEAASGPLGIPPPVTSQSPQGGASKSSEYPPQQTNSTEQHKPQWDLTRIHPLSSLVEQDPNLFGKQVIGGIQRLENRVEVLKGIEEALDPKSESGIVVFTRLSDGRERRLDQSEIQQMRRQLQPKHLGKNKEEAYLRGLEDALTMIKDHINEEQTFGKAEKSKSKTGGSDLRNN